MRKLKAKIVLDSTDIRTYKNADGKEVPSVTSLLSMIKFESLEKLAGVPGFDKVFKEAGERGTFVHRYIENDINGKLTKVPDEYREYIKQWILFKLNNSHLFITTPLKGTEIKVSGSEYGGTVDYRVKGTLVDWKTSSNLTMNDDLLFKYKMQLAAYADIFDGNIHQAKIVFITPKGTKTISIGDLELNRYAEGFYNLLSVYDKYTNGKELPGTMNMLGRAIPVTTTANDANTIIEPEIQTFDSEPNRIDIRADIRGLDTGIAIVDEAGTEIDPSRFVEGMQHIPSVQTFEGVFDYDDAVHATTVPAMPSADTTVPLDDAVLGTISTPLADNSSNALYERIARRAAREAVNEFNTDNTHS